MAFPVRKRRKTRVPTVTSAMHLGSRALLCAMKKSPKIRAFIGPMNVEIHVKQSADDRAVYVRGIDSVQNAADIVECLAKQLSPT